MRFARITAGLAAAATAGLLAFPGAAHAADNALAATSATVSPETQSIPDTNMPKGSHTFNFNPSTAAWSSALVSIDRTVTNGLNTLTLGDTLQLDLQYSLDNGTTWTDLCGSMLRGGTIVTKGVTLTTDTLECSASAPFPTGTTWQLIATASTRVFIAGSVTYTDSGT